MSSERWSKRYLGEKMKKQCVALLGSFLFVLPALAQGVEAPCPPCSVEIRYSDAAGLYCVGSNTTRQRYKILVGITFSYTDLNGRQQATWEFKDYLFPGDNDKNLGVSTARHRPRLIQVNYSSATPY